MNVFIPTPLRSYTGEKAEVQASGNTVGILLADLNRQYPGIRFRMVNEQDEIRQHIKFFLNQEQVHLLETPVGPNDEIIIICALSGG
jgi:molybdopterin converting factor small subunit